MASRTLRAVLGDLTIPVHPNFDLQESGNVDYVNPVLLNNLLVLYTNALFELSIMNLETQGQLDKARTERRVFESEQLNTKTKILSQHEVPSTYGKNLLLTEAFVRSKLRELSVERYEAYAALDSDIQKLDRLLARLELLASSTHGVAQTVEFACKNIQTHLSFVKKEQEWSRQAV